MEKLRCEVTWKNLSLTTGDGKQILKDVCGQAKPYTLNAIVGPSGSGKTTFLDCIAGRISSSSTLEGDILVNGLQRNIETWPKVAAYVGQHFHAYEWQTVYETLVFAAEIRLPSKSDANEKVEGLINLLGLNSSRDTFIERLSGGERIRVSLGIELLGDPPIILLDEPVSGLDSYNALNILTVAKAIADMGKTVILTIHQPSYKMLSYFNRLILMSQGSVVFQGRLDDCIQFFSECGYECPKNITPTDFFLDAIALDTRDTQTVDESIKRINAIRNEWNFVKTIEEPTVQEKIRLSDRKDHMFNFHVILKRSIVDYFRNTQYIKTRVFQRVMVVIFFGTAFYGLGVEGSNIFSFRGAITFIFQNELFGVVGPIFNLFGTEKKIILRERMSGLYTGYEVYYSKLVTEVLLNLMYAMPHNLIVYYLIGFQRDLAVLGTFLVVICVVILYGVSYGLTISTVTSSPSSAQALGMTINVVFLLYSGAFLSPDTLPRLLRWVVWVSPMHYALRAIIHNQLDNIEDGERLSPLIVSGKSTMKDFGMDGFGTWECILVILVYSIILQVIGSTVFHYKTINNLKLSTKTRMQI